MLKCNNNKIFTEFLQVKIEAIPVYNNVVKIKNSQMQTNYIDE